MTTYKFNKALNNNDATLLTNNVYLTIMCPPFSLVVIIQNTQEYVDLRQMRVKLMEKEINFILGKNKGHIHGIVVSQNCS